MPPPPPPPSRRNDSKASAASKEENIYIPSFISKRPFYAGEEGDQTDYLQHQRLHKANDDQSKWYDRGKKLGPAATKYRKGACENCGAMTHKAKDCLNRPRAKGAKWTGRDIQADEVIQDVQLGWDAKRDRWNGYDPKEYRTVVERYNQMDELRSLVSGANKDGSKEDIDGEDGEGDKDTGEKYAEESDMGRHQSTATRQLRIREDTAKYLLNLDLESAKYDPKTRTMVDAGATADKAAQLFAEEGFLRAAGDAAEFEKAQSYAWEAQEKSGDTRQHIQANPTAGEFYRKKEREDAEKKRADRIKALQDKYGAGDAALTTTMPAALREAAAIVTESEHFVEYDEATGLIKGAPKVIAKSKYDEDVHVNNHTSVWGSWWSNFRWGYACCHSFIKNSYCTGEEGKEAWEAAEKQRMGTNLIEEGTSSAREEEEQQVEADEDDKEVQAKKQQASKKRTMEDMMGGISEADLDEYRKKRAVADDPMAKFLGSEELLR
ncbi:Pre-mRNA splicing Prp18-interacting factor-domain-containing protein [Hypoxylon fragiforme]|uniref:Pre-mRNA splicing Prp18-interacting factor-domain-containing protein n=1 Tax=Hypoxylon fragiforme TaxID=63214 RepID=UPI0020C6E2D6|nr:Pre-mRNA splicing Prp18-interacting factor-domain-containing protein [Hypoxylon fragiforme]KAI2605404.1 Pre-mRNA splicing Prp18-interacting factor-domain-containing protein [Hypoxylon fragiforme]